jgi:hypothetical protein
VELFFTCISHLRGAVFKFYSFSLLWSCFTLLEFFTSVELFFTFTVFHFCGAVFSLYSFSLLWSCFSVLQSFSLLWSWFTLSS